MQIQNNWAFFDSMRRKVGALRHTTQDAQGNVSIGDWRVTKITRKQICECE
jgi:acyl CoA:acetate/3-ketoacid CoA transferase